MILLSKNIISWRLKEKNIAAKIESTNCSLLLNFSFGYLREGLIDWSQQDTMKVQCGGREQSRKRKQCQEEYRSNFKNTWVKIWWCLSLCCHRSQSYLIKSHPQSHTSFPIKKTHFFRGAIYLQPKRNSPGIQPMSYVHGDFPGN